MDRAVVCPSYGLKYISKASDEDGDASYPGSNDPVQLYDLVADPTEQVNVASEASYADTVTLLAAYIACHQSDTARVGSSACDPEALVQQRVGRRGRRPWISRAGFCRNTARELLGRYRCSI